MIDTFKVSWVSARLTPAEDAKLSGLALALGVSRSEVVRLLLSQAKAQLTPAQTIVAADRSQQQLQIA